MGLQKNKINRWKLAKKKDEMTNNDIQNTTQKTKDWATRTPL